MDISDNQIRYEFKKPQHDNVAITLASSGEENLLSEIPIVDVENLDTLHNMAKTHVESTRIGEFTEYKFLLERQIGHDFTKLYSVLTPLFDKTDLERKKFRNKVVRFRSLTFILYVIYFLLIPRFLNTLNICLNSKSFSLDSLPLELVLLGVGLLLPLIFVFTIRKSTISNLREDASVFGSHFNGYLQLLRSKGEYALKNVNNHDPATDSKGERAKKWAFIAMWLFQLNQIYDRYVTTASWRAQTSNMCIAIVSRVMKLLVLIFVVGYQIVFQSSWFLQDVLITIGALLLIITGQLLWDTGLGERESNNLWADNFVKSISGRKPEEISKNHPNTQVSAMIGDIRIKEWQAQQ